MHPLLEVMPWTMPCTVSESWPNHVQFHSIGWRSNDSEQINCHKTRAIVTTWTKCTYSYLSFVAKSESWRIWILEILAASSLSFFVLYPQSTALLKWLWLAALSTIQNALKSQTKAYTDAREWQYRDKGPSYQAPVHWWHSSVSQVDLPQSYKICTF